YLARTASGLYAGFGGVALLASFDVGRHRPLILYLGWISLPGAAYLLILDLALAMPWWWVAAEGPVVLLSGVPLLLLSMPPHPRPLSHQGRGEQEAPPSPEPTAEGIYRAETRR